MKKNPGTIKWVKEYALPNNVLMTMCCQSMYYMTIVNVLMTM